MLKVGLTGGYASGKSFVAGELAKRGCHVIFADQLGHATLEPDGEAYAPAIEAFGRTMLNENGTIDRKKLGEIVFASPDLLAKLSGFVHPAVFRLEEKMIREFQAEDPNGITVIEAAILIETGRYAWLDRLILTACDPEVQISRGMSRDGLTREQVLARMSKQMPLEEKKKRASYIIDTSGTKEETSRQVEVVFRELRQLAEARQA